jgi:hypothetical protein
MVRAKNTYRAYGEGFELIKRFNSDAEIIQKSNSYFLGNGFTRYEFTKDYNVVKEVIRKFGDDFILDDIDFGKFVNTVFVWQGKKRLKF